MTIKARLGVGALVTLCLALAIMLVAIATANVIPTANVAESRDAASSEYTDKLSDYGVCIGLSAKACYNDDWTPAFEENEVPRVLMFSRTAGPRHGHLGPELDEGLNPPLSEQNVAQQAVVDWGGKYGFEVDWTEDLTVFGDPNRLRDYNTIVFLSNTRDFLDDAAQTALRQYVRSRGGFVAVHNSLGAEYNWDYFQGLLGGANFYDHGPRRDGVVETLDEKDVSTKGLPNRWNFNDEWYNLEPEPSPFVRILAKVDTDTLDPVGGSVHPGHEGNHPISWCHYFDGGRSWVTSLGHNESAWQGTAENSRYFEEHVLGGILGTAGEKPFCR